MEEGYPRAGESLSEKTHYKIILPRIPGYIEPGHVMTGDADYILLQ